MIDFEINNRSSLFLKEQKSLNNPKNIFMKVRKWIDFYL